MELDKKLRAILNAAFEDADERNNEYLTPEHLFYILLGVPYVIDVLESCDVPVDEIRRKILIYIETSIPQVHPTRSPEQSVSFQNVVERAIFMSQNAEKRAVDLADLLIAIFDETKSHSSYILRSAGLTRVDLLEAISHEVQSENYRHKDFSEKETVDNLAEEEESSGGKRRRDFLSYYTTDLTQEAREGKLDPLIGREDVVERTLLVLCRRTKNNPIHIGEVGVGKTAITHGIAQRLAEKKVPTVLQDSSIFSLDLGSLLAGTRYRGDFEKRVKTILDELAKRQNIILFIDEIHTLVGAGAVSGGSMDASNLFKPMLANGTLRCIGATTFSEYKRFFEKDHALARRFQRIDVEEPTEDETVGILKGLRKRYEDFHHVHYSDESLKLTVQLASQYITVRHLPDKAIDVIDEAGAMLRLKEEKSTERWPTIHASQIEEVVSRIAKVPRKTVGKSEKEALKNLGKHLHENIFGQALAIDQVVSAVKRSRAGFRDLQKPVASFLFVGPTGVGKTELARQLASNLGIVLHRLDMSEYQEKHTVSRLLGAPPGYVGYEVGGILSDLLRKQPRCVLLLDEIEKAHSEVYNVLLQIMDYATITDAVGRRVSFHNSIIIMTSNAGARELGKPLIGFDDTQQKTDVVFTAVEQFFTPEFRNRLDKVILFNHLTDDVVRDIVRKELDAFGKTLVEKNIQFTYSDSLLDWLADKGYSSEFGARNIVRAVEEHVKEQFIDLTLFGRLHKGGRAHAEILQNRVEIRSESPPKSSTKKSPPKL